MTDPAPLDHLNIREKAAQLVFPRLGSNMPPPVPADDDAERIASLLEQLPFGGLIVFNGDVRSTTSVLQDLQRRSRFPLLVATDMEAGLGQQFSGATVFPHALAFDETGKDAIPFVEAAARVAAREALAAGIHVALAPVADVHRNPQNPIISSRAWSRDPIRAGELSSAYVRAVQSEGLLATAKHFPGHGGTAGDSHVELPISDDTRDVLERTDFVPFRACIEAGVSLVMTAHVAYPALDPEKRPATLSRPILHDVLRHQLGFRGAIISDSMMMKGVQESGDATNARLLMAGADILLDPLDPMQAVDEIATAVEAGRIAESDLNRAVARVRALRESVSLRHGRSFFTTPHSAQQASPWAAPDAQALAAEVAKRTLRPANGFSDVQRRVQETPDSVLFAVTPSPRSAPLTGPFEDALRARLPHARVIRLEPDAPASNETRRQLERAVFVVFAVFARPAAWHTYGLSDAQQRLVSARLRQGEAAVILLANEDLAHALPSAPILFAHSDMAPSQKAAVEHLFREN